MSTVFAKVALLSIKASYPAQQVGLVQKIGLLHLIAKRSPKLMIYAIACQE
ncbi:MULTISPECIES: hypothetical protein [Trichocoleus]|uniref:hypothetical protein n=1 Tax=Trichocoleus TaxID=450526 RepID=UPI0016837655|nr:hypothetical protein [Trichocoleus sp. FACHB-262]MBD2120697.1 hypothetical protein [Trichocoleus sp. FACHB-262]